VPSDDESPEKWPEDILSVTSKFVIVDGLITVEHLPNPSWLIRKRNKDSTFTTPYSWVATMSHFTPEECEVKGYIARDNHMSLDDYKAMQRIAGKLGFDYGLYERFDESGMLRKSKKSPTIK